MERKRVKTSRTPGEFRKNIIQLTSSLSKERNYDNYVVLKQCEELLKDEILNTMRSLPSFLPNLPFEILNEIFLFLDVDQMMNISLVCKWFHDTIFKNQIHMKLRCHKLYPSLKGIQKLEDPEDSNFGWKMFLKLKTEERRRRVRMEGDENVYFKEFDPEREEFKILREGLIITKFVLNESDDNYKQWETQDLLIDGKFLTKEGKVAFYFTYEHKVHSYYGAHMAIDPFDVGKSGFYCCKPNEDDLFVDLVILADAMTKEWANRIDEGMKKIRELLGFGEELSSVRLFDFFENQVFNVKDFIVEKLLEFYEIMDK